MRYIAFGMVALVALIMSSCSQPQPQPQPQPVAPAPVQPAPEQPQPEPVQPPVIPHSTSWMRGYNDGYNGNWLGPASWVVSNEYRAGWTAGNRDLKDGKPHRFNP